MRKILVPLLVAIVAGLSVWLFEDQPDKGPTVTPRTQSTPDSFMENFTTQVLNADGQLQYQLQAAYMAHYADDNHSDLTQPQFIAYRPDGQRWTVVAESGQALNGSRQIMLNGAVTLKRQANDAAPVNLEIRTRDVKIVPADDYAETEQHTTIIRNEGTLNTTGLQVHFREGRVLLLSQVRGLYAP
jgi:lipopolysaccharide export system protein LptC